MAARLQLVSLFGNVPLLSTFPIGKCSHFRGLCWQIGNDVGSFSKINQSINMSDRGQSSEYCWWCPPGSLMDVVDALLATFAFAAFVA